MYKVIVEFYDTEDANHLYRVGDIYPRSGLEVSDKRISLLTSDKNRRRVPLIESGDKKEAPKKDEPITADAIANMPFFTLKSEAKKRGIDVADKKAAQLREELIAAL